MSRKLTYDTWLFAAALLLIVIGLVMIYSASAIITVQKTGSDNPYYFITRQCGWLIAGSALMVIVMHLDLARLRDRRVIYSVMAIVLAAAAMVFAAGIRWNRIAVFVLMLIPAAILALLSAAYRRDRLLTFLNPEADPRGKGFQAMQSLIAVGTGGLRGLGIGNGRQKLFFLPEPHTDFIFSIVGEELGFVGCLAIIGVFAFLAWRGFRITQYSQERFNFYAALGLTLMIGIQALINMSVALCLVPTKGLPLPLVSYGGSSLIASLMAVGLLLNLSQQSG